MRWERRRYRGHKVWIHVDEAGAPRLDDRGLAALRYRPDDERTYTVRPSEVQPLGGDEEREADPSPDAVRIWADGASSGNPGPAGVGVVLRWRGHRRELSRALGPATNNVAELEAVRAALEAVRRPDLPVRLHTDSAYVIGLLRDGHRPRANEALVARVLREMARFRDLQFLKVPAHAGHAENERADALARRALRRPPPAAPGEAGGFA